MKLVPILMVLVLGFLAYYLYNNYESFLDLGSYVAQPQEEQSTYVHVPDAEKPNITASTYMPLLFPNIRFGRMPVMYYLDLESGKKVPWFKEDFNVPNVIEAFDTWSQATGSRLSFIRTYDEDDTQITVSWTTNLNATNTTRGVGEGGPIALVDTGLFNLTTKAVMHMLPAGTKCVDVNRALHELGHVLGFDHTSDSEDIMYPYESCSRRITDKETRTLESLYLLDSMPQFRLSNISAFVHGGLLDINFTVKNIGIIESPPTSLAIYADDKMVHTLSIESLKPGSGLVEFLKNARMQPGSQKLKLAVDPQENIGVWYRNLTVVELNLY